MSARQLVDLTINVTIFLPPSPSIKALENDPENTIAWLNKASALESLGRLDGAKEVEAKGQELWDAGK